VEFLLRKSIEVVLTNGRFMLAEKPGRLERPARCGFNTAVENSARHPQWNCHRDRFIY